MANHKSALKRHRQNLKIRARNRSTKSAYRTAIKQTRTAAEAGEFDKAQEHFKVAEVKVAKAANKGVLHKNTAARTISRLSKFLKGAQAA